MVAVVFTRHPGANLAGNEHRLRRRKQFPAFGKRQPELFKIVVTTVYHVDRYGSFAVSIPSPSKRASMINFMLYLPTNVILPE